MRLPRDLSGKEFCKLLKPFGYEIVRQESSHMRLTSNYKGIQHHLTVPDHPELKIGTLKALLRQVSNYLEQDPGRVAEQLFGR